MYHIRTREQRQQSKSIIFKTTTMNNTQFYINWNQAQEVNQEVNQAQQQEQEQALKEFLDSNHDFTDAKDLQYYADKTGKDIFWLLENGKNINTLLKQTLIMGADLEDCINTDFQCMMQKHKDYEICFYLENYDPYNKKMNYEPVYNYEIEDYCGSYWEQLNDKDKKLIKQEFNN